MKEKLPKQTSKKQKFLKSKVLIDPETGESYPVQMNAVEDRDFNFHKVWMQNLIYSLDGIANKRLQLAFWIIDHLNKENQLTMTYRQIAEATGLSLRTVTVTMQLLLSGKPPFLKKINMGVYTVNPEVLFKGSHSNRMGIVYEFTRDINTVSEPSSEAQEREEREKGISLFPNEANGASEGKTA